MTNEAGRAVERRSSPLRDTVTHPDIFTVLILLCVTSMPLIPAAWLIATPVAIVLVVIMARCKGRLPFRLPLSWTGRDYGSPVAGSDRSFQRGQGMLFLGNAFDSEEEVWISNSDARRHALVLATTGAGKALPDDTLVLTPDGWRQNGDLRPGDPVIHPSGRVQTILSVHPQGRVPAVRLTLADGREVECSRDHLWRVRLRGARIHINHTGQTGVWTTADIGIAQQLGTLQGEERLRIFLPLPQPVDGIANAPSLTRQQAETAAARGLDRLRAMPSLSDRASARMSWLADFLKRRGARHPSGDDNPWIACPCLSGQDGFLLRQIIWSLGGIAFQVTRNTQILVRFQLPGQETLDSRFRPPDPSLHRDGIEVIGAAGSIVDAEAQGIRSRLRQWLQAERISVTSAAQILRDLRQSSTKSMTCIRTDSPDGMFIAENYVPTHNTEFLLGLVSQALMWSSGFLFIDGKGTAEFHAKAWSIVSRFGRQDDYRVLNFTDSGGSDMSAGGPETQSNTLNPFSHGSADQLMNLIVSLMGESGNTGEMWRHRAMALVTSTMKVLVEMRDAGDIMLDVQTIRDFLPLGVGIRAKFVTGRRITEIAQIPDAAWDEMCSRGGLIELYLRAIRGDFSETSRLALKGFFDSLPGFNLQKAMNGEPQEGKAAEQYGFLSMQLTKPLGSLADDFGHIFRTPIGEVDMDDVVLNRRVLVVLLPALQKAPEEMRNCGRIVVAMLKMMMGRAAGSRLEGDKRELVDRRPTRAPSPFIAVLDEAGYYMVKGIDTMMAQARSLGFMIIIAGQDMAAMQSVSPQIAETAAANARLTVAGATEDAKMTWNFLRSKFAQHRVALNSGQVAKTGWWSTRWVDRPDKQFVETDRVPITELQKLREGEFYFLMESKLVKARGFYIKDCWAPWLAVNKLLTIRGPYDTQLKQQNDQETRFFDALTTIGKLLLDPHELTRREKNYPFDPHDSLYCAVQTTQTSLTEQLRQNPSRPPDTHEATLRGLIFAARHRVPNPDHDDPDDGQDWS